MHTHDAVLIVSRHWILNQWVDAKRSLKNARSRVDERNMPTLILVFWESRNLLDSFVCCLLANHPVLLFFKEVAPHFSPNRISSTNS